jgi:two-component system, NarL family, invasion response regulator UvrY
MLRILIADDHSIVRKGIRQIISEEFPDVKIDEAAEYNLIVSDLIMPGKNTIEVIKDLRHMNIKTPVIILSMHPEEQYAIRVLKAGGSGYLTKESAPEELVQAIHTVNQGKKYISQSVSEILLHQMDSAGDKPVHEKLSDREFTVFRLIASGKTVGEIAQILNLSIPTISTYRARIIEKTNLRTNADLMKYAINNQIV